MYFLGHPSSVREAYFKVYVITFYMYTALFCDCLLWNLSGGGGPVALQSPAKLLSDGDDGHDLEVSAAFELCALGASFCLRLMFSHSRMCVWVCVCATATAAPDVCGGHHCLRRWDDPPEGHAIQGHCPCRDDHRAVLSPRVWQPLAGLGV